MKKFEAYDIEVARKTAGCGGWQDAIGALNNWADQAADNNRRVLVKLREDNWEASVIEYFDLKVLGYVGKKDGDYAIVLI